MKRRTISMICVFAGILSAAAALIMAMLGKLDMKTGMMTAVIGALIFFLAAWLVNYKNSAYGGKFGSRYPDAHH